MNNKKSAIWIFIIITLVFHADKLILGSFAPVIVHDTFSSEFSRYDVIGKLFIKHGFTAWDPNSAGGMPAYAYHFAPYYILSLLSAIFPSWIIYSVLVINLMIFAGHGMYRFLREYTELPYWLSLIGGIIFMLSSQIHVHTPVLFLMYLFPVFFVWYTDIFQENNPIRIKALRIVGINIIFLFSYLILTVPLVPFLHVLLLLVMNNHKGRKKKEMLILSIIIWVGYIIVSAPVIYSLYDMIPYAQIRTYTTTLSFKSFIVQFFRHLLATSVVTLLLPIILCGLTLIPISKKVRRYFYILLVVVVITALSKSGFANNTFLAKLEVLKLFVFLLPIVTTVFAFISIDEFTLKKNFSLVYSTLIICVTMAVFLICYHYPTILELKRRNVSIPWVLLNITTYFLIISVYFLNHRSASLSGYIRIRQSSMYLLTISTVILFIGVLLLVRVQRLSNEKFPHRMKFDNQSIIESLNESNSSPYRVASLGYKYRHTTAKYGLETIDRRSPIFLRSYKEYFKLIVNPQLKSKKMQEGFDNYPYELSIKSDEQPGDGIIPLNIPLLLLSNVKYLVSHYYNPDLVAISNAILKSKHDDETIPKSIALIKQLGADYLAVIDKITYSPIYIYELKNTVERGYLSRKVEVLPSDQEVLEKLSDATLNTLTESVFFSKDDFPDTELTRYKNIPLSQFSSNKINMTYYSPDKIIFNASLSSPAVLVVTNNYYPKWTASINGLETRIFRANHTFQAILLKDEGEHEIVFEYKDQKLWVMHVFIPLGALLINLPLIYITYNASSRFRPVVKRQKPVVKSQ